MIIFDLLHFLKTELMGVTNQRDDIYGRIT